MPLVHLALRKSIRDNRYFAVGLVIGTGEFKSEMQQIPLRGVAQVVFYNLGGDRHRRR